MIAFALVAKLFEGWIASAAAKAAGLTKLVAATACS